MRWLSSTFPRGWPGLGLLLLRVVAGATMIAPGWSAIHSTIPSLPASATAALAIGAGVAVVAGLFTPVSAGLLSLGTIGVAFGWIPWSSAEPIHPGGATILVVSMCVTIALVGPGAWSVDARARGRREITIPRQRAE